MLRRLALLLDCVAARAVAADFGVKAVGAPEPNEWGDWKDRPDFRRGEPMTQKKF